MVVGYSVIRLAVGLSIGHGSNLCVGKFFLFMNKKRDSLNSNDKSGSSKGTDIVSVVLIRNVSIIVL